MTDDEISRFFSEEDVKKAFQFPDWPAGTEIVCYCRSTDSRDAIEQIAQRGGWKIEKYVHIDELPIAKFCKPGQVMFAKREAMEWKRDPTMPTYEEWRNQMLGGLRIGNGNTQWAHPPTVTCLSSASERGINSNNLIKTKAIWE